MADQHRYIFWIDRVQSLVRRIEFPPVVAPLTSGAPVQTMPLMLELKNAAFSSGVAPQPSPLPQTPRYVARFVPLPPPRPASILGNKLSPFSLSVGDRTLEFGKRPPGETVT